MESPETQWITEGRTSKMITRSVSALRNDRWRGKGLPYVKNGRQVRYLLKDVIDYMESKKITPSN